MTMTHEERIQNLMQFGYTRRHAEFVQFAARHAGYFLRRQYCEYFGLKRGKEDNRFIQKLLGNKHVVPSHLAYGSKLYSLTSRTLFEAIDHEDNRNRRHMHDALTIKARLMGLDFAIEHRNWEWFPTETDRVALFTERLGVDLSRLPTWRYAARKHSLESQKSSLTFRYFVDKPPIALDPKQPGHCTFVFVDPGYNGIQSFTTFVDNYQHLLRDLSAGFTLLYLACIPRNFQLAQRAFETTLRIGAGVPEDPLVQQCQEYFEDRQEHDRNGWTNFDPARIKRFRLAQNELTGERFETLYQRWKSAPVKDTIQRIVQPFDGDALRSRAHFETRIAAEIYDGFGRSSLVPARSAKVKSLATSAITADQQPASPSVAFQNHDPVAL